MAINQMVIDLSKCVGCGTCAIACKLGNNTQKRANGQTFNWADFCNETTGVFPSTKWTAVPVKCNHCNDPLCVAACPVEPTTDATCVDNKRRAMYKLKDANGGLVLHDDSRCIGCRRCQRACPYSIIDVGAYKAQWSAISYNGGTPQAEWQNTSALIYQCTPSAADVMSASDADSDGKTCPPYRTKWAPEGGHVIDDIRRPNITEKCYGCFHRTLAAAGTKKLPYCVQACPANARKIVVGADSFADDEGTTYTGDSVKTYNGLPAISTLKVLAHGSNKRPTLVGVVSTGSSQPQTYYLGDFSNR
jgi:Fe-S-cluster-containing dehydrogenase component